MATVKKEVIKPPPAEPLVDPPVLLFIERLQSPLVTISGSDLKNKIKGTKKIAAIIKVNEKATVKKEENKPPPAEPLDDPPVLLFIERLQTPIVTISGSDLKNKIKGTKKIAAIIKLIITGTRFIKTASFQRPRNI